MACQGTQHTLGLHGPAALRHNRRIRESVCVNTEYRQFSGGRCRLYTRLLSKSYLYAESSELSHRHVPKRNTCDPQWKRFFSRCVSACNAVPLQTSAMIADLIGKLHLASAYGRVEPRVNDGYRYWQYSHAPRDDWEQGHDYADWVRTQGYILGELNQNPEGVPAELHQTTWCAEKTIAFIREDRDCPWLASVNIYDPHPPFNPPQTHREQYNPADMPEPLFQNSDLEQQTRLQAVDFQSKVRTPDELDNSESNLTADPTPRSRCSRDERCQNPHSCLLRDDPTN